MKRGAGLVEHNRKMTDPSSDMEKRRVYWGKSAKGGANERSYWRSVNSARKYQPGGRRKVNKKKELEMKAGYPGGRIRPDRTKEGKNRFCDRLKNM